MSWTSTEGGRGAAAGIGAARVVVVDDHPIVRHGIRLIFECLPDFVVGGEAGDGRTAVELARTVRPQVVVTNATMPGLNGVDVVGAIREAVPEAAIVLFTGRCELGLLRAALRAGARGVVLKEEAPDVLVEAVRDGRIGRPFVSPRTMQLLLGPAGAPGGAAAAPGRDALPDVFDLLTVREREVLQLLAEGKETKEIAWELAVSSKTVQGHRAMLANRLGIASVAQLTKYAIRTGLTGPNY